VRRDCQFLEVLIEQFADRPELVGHHALVEPSHCSIWLVLDDGPPVGNPGTGDAH
jgi:hypothetical protein